MDDLEVFLALAASAFFVALAFGLLLRYRQVSQSISDSTDLGRDLWQVLDQRLKKQDERILDVMGRMEVIQSRVTERAVPAPPTTQVSSKEAAVVEGKTAPLAPGRSQIATREPVISITSLDKTELAVMKLLSGEARSSVEITKQTGKSREHIARLMKSLFDRGLVARDDSNRPFVYQLTDEGRRSLLT